jgi:hypothetical protein
MISFIGAFTLYRHLILAEYGIYFSYGSAIIEGLILGKIVLIGEALHVGERETKRTTHLANTPQVPALWPALLRLQSPEEAVSGSSTTSSCSMQSVASRLGTERGAGSLDHDVRRVNSLLRLWGAPETVRG